MEPKQPPTKDQVSPDSSLAFVSSPFSQSEHTCAHCCGMQKALLDTWSREQCTRNVKCARSMHFFVQSSVACLLLGCKARLMLVFCCCGFTGSPCSISQNGRGSTYNLRHQFQGHLVTASFRFAGDDGCGSCPINSSLLCHLCKGNPTRMDLVSTKSTIGNEGFSSQWVS